MTNRFRPGDPLNSAPLRRAEPNSVDQQEGATRSEEAIKNFVSPQGMPTAKAPQAGSSAMRELNRSFAALKPLGGPIGRNPWVYARSTSPPIPQPNPQTPPKLALHLQEMQFDLVKQDVGAIKTHINSMRAIAWSTTTAEQKTEALEALQPVLGQSMCQGDAEITRSACQLMRQIDGPKPAHLEALYAQGSDGMSGLQTAIEQGHTESICAYVDAVVDLQLGDPAQVAQLFDHPSAISNAFKLDKLDAAKVICEAFTKCEIDPRKALSALEDIRNTTENIDTNQNAKILIDEAIAQQTKRPVVKAFATIGGHEFFDTNQTARDPAKANKEKPTLISELVIALTEKKQSLSSYKDKTAFMPNANMATAHAEIGVIQQAFDAGLTQGAEMNLTVTGQAVCAYCRSDINKMAKAAGLKSITITERSTGLTLYWEQGMKKLKPKVVL
jgi:hypothetical protein